MSFFKKLKSKVGNALIPVIGTILALTILAGSVVAVALNSSKIVYRQNKLEKQNNGREILYMASKWFSQQLNDGVEDSVAKQTVKETFEYIQITKEIKDGEPVYYLWYPTDEDEFKKAGSVEDYDGTWWKATLKLTQSDDDNSNGNKDGEINDTLFSREAKLDELYNIGNLMTTYLVDEGLLPTRKYALNEISLIESDIDTFDEAFIKLNNTGVLELDSIEVALLGYINQYDHMAYVSEDGNNYSIVYQTGNLGGNYYWQDGNDSYTTWTYRQEYDIELLLDMLEYYNEGYRFYYNTYLDRYSYVTADYYYDESNDTHLVAVEGYYYNGQFYSRSNILRFQLGTTLEFADKLADYIFWKNVDRLALYLDDFKSVINAHANNQWGGGANSYSYKWTDDGLTVYTWRGYYQDGGYWDWPYTITQVDNFLIQCGYTDDGTTVSSQKIYDALIESIRTETESKIIYDKYEEQYGEITWETLRDWVCNKHNVFDIKRNVTIQYTYSSGWSTRTKNLTYNAWYSTDKMAKAIIDYVGHHLQEKYAKGQKIQGNTIGMISDDTSKLLQDVQFLMVGNRLKVQYHFNLVLSRNNGELVNYFSEQTADDIYFTVEQFKETFYNELAWCLKSRVTISEQENTIIEKKSRQELKEQLVEPIRYQYLPLTTTLDEIIGTNDKVGMKQSTIALKVLTYYLEHNKNSLINFDSVQITNVTIQDSPNFNGCFQMNITYKLDNYEQELIAFVKYMTNNVYNSAYANNNGFVQRLNGNYSMRQDSDGTYKAFFSEVAIKDNSNEILNVSDIDKTQAIVTVLPWKELLDDNGNQISSKATINGQEYNVIGKDNISMLKNVNQNLLYNGSIEDLGQRDFKILIKSGKTLIINGDLTLLHNQTLQLEDGAMILVNGDFKVFYEFNGKGNDSTDNSGVPTYSTTWSRCISFFKQHGVNIIAEDAKIMVNGNMTYRGYKARYSTNTRTNYSLSGQNLDLLFDQTTFGVDDCEYKESTKKYQHDTDECRSLLSGIYIINGDVRFESWAEYSNPDATNNQKYYMYRNAYSNPLINATFYVDGTFDMTGLYMSGLYDPCRANFIFAKSITQPLIALNSTLQRWSFGTTNGYENWQDTHGYLFMICEDAIDFSKVQFACTNLFTPYSQLLGAINENQQSSTNFSEFIDKDTFTAMYPDKNIINRWGLSSLLKQGLKMIYDANDMGAIRIEDEITGDDDW